MHKIEQMEMVDLERYLDSVSDKELDAIAAGNFAPLAAPKEKPKFKIQLPELPENVSKSDAFFFAAMVPPLGVILYCAIMLASPLWLPLTVDKVAYDKAASAQVPTRVYYCADTDYEGRFCFLRDNQAGIEKVVIRGDR